VIVRFTRAMTGRILEECQLCMRETMRQTGNELKTEGPRTGPLRDEGGRQSQAGRGDSHPRPSERMSRATEGIGSLTPVLAVAR